MRAVLRRVLRTFFGLRRALRDGGKSAGTSGALADPRAQDPWMAALLTALGERYGLGEDKPEGAQVLRRTGRARFNPMLVYLRAAERTVTGFYEVRGHGRDPAAAARQLLDAKVTPALQDRGLAAAADRLEEWGGVVVVRRYQGRCDDAAQAASAIRFMCQESDQVMDTAAE